MGPKEHLRLKEDIILMSVKDAKDAGDDAIVADAADVAVWL